MKRIFAIFGALLVTTLATAQSNPNPLSAAQYSAWRSAIVSGNSTTGAVSIVVSAPSPTAGGIVVPIQIAFNSVELAPVLINDGNAETVTPTAITIGPCPASSLGANTSGSCATISATFLNLHGASGASQIVQDGSYGLGTAHALAFAQGGGIVRTDKTWSLLGGTTAMEVALIPYSNVTVVDDTGAAITYYSPQPTTLSALATPATRSAAAGATQVISGTATGTFAASTYFVAVTCVDIMGGESVASASFSFTATASVALNWAAPAAQTGCVGWIPYAGLTGTSTMYRITPTASMGTLTTLETVTPAFAITNATYGQTGSAAVTPSPNTTNSLAPGYVVNTYRLNTQSAQTWSYQGSASPNLGAFRTNFGPFVASAGGTTGQIEVLGTVPLPLAYLNYINKSVRVHGHITMTAGTSETPVLKVQLGPTFTTGTPTNICQFANTTALSAAVYSLAFTCTVTTNAIGATGTVMPDGMAVVALGAGTTAGTSMPELGTAAITDSVSTQDWLYVTYIPTSGTNTAAQLLDLHFEALD